MKERKNIRLKNYDYKSDGYYFVTVVSKLRQNIFTGREEIIERELLDVQRKISGLSLDYFVIMSNHVHIIFVLKNCEFHLGEIVRRFKAKASHILDTNVWQAN